MSVRRATARGQGLGSPGKDVGLSRGKPSKPSARFRYTNWKGEEGIRHVLPLTIYWGSNEWHLEPCWLLNAYDFDKMTGRTFAMKNIKDWEDLI